MIASVLKVGLVIGTFGGVAFALAPGPPPSTVAPPAKTEPPGVTTVGKVQWVSRPVKVDRIKLNEPPPPPPPPPPVAVPEKPMMLAVLKPAPVVVEKETPRSTRKAGPERRCKRPGATARSWYRIKGVKYYCRINRD